MELQEFIKNFAEQFDETNVSEFNETVKFKEFVDWSSMVALSIIAMIDAEYGVTIKGDDIRKSETIEDLFLIIKKYKE